MHAPRIRRLIAFAAAAVVLASAGIVAQQNTGPGPRVEISFAAAARSAPVTGRVYVAISRVERSADADSAGRFDRRAALRRERRQPRAGRSRGDRRDDLGHPVASLRDIPAGDYWVQPFVNVYTKFARADGHTVWLHMDQWEGQNWSRSPGNLFGDPVQIHFDPASTTPIRARRRQGHSADRRCRRTRTRSSASRSRVRF